VFRAFWGKSSSTASFEVGFEVGGASVLLMKFDIPSHASSDKVEKFVPVNMAI